MYDFLDQRVTSLDNGGRFLIWSMRRWVEAVSLRQCPPSAVAGAFAKWGMIAALPDFHRFMVLLGKDGLQTFSFRPLACHCVAEDEALLLSLFRAMRDTRPDQVKSTMDLLVSDEAAGPLLLAVTGIARQLGRVELIPEAPLRSNKPDRQPLQPSDEG